MYTFSTNSRRRSSSVLLIALAALLLLAIGASAQAPILRSVTSNSQTVTLTVQATTATQAYYIYRTTTSGGEQFGQQVATQFLNSPPAVGATFTLTDAAAPYGQTLYYKVSIAGGSSFRSPLSNELSIVSRVIPAPTQLAATGASGQVLLSWGGNSVATSYNVKRSTASGGPYTTVASGITATGYTDTTVSNGMAYYYIVSAVGPTGESLNSAVAGATPMAAGVNLRINCGGGQYTDMAGNTWFADQGFSDGGPVTTTDSISGTSDPALYQAQHTSGSQFFGYMLPVPNGQYTLTLLFADIQGDQGQNSSNVTANGQQLLTNFSPYTAAGNVADAAVVKTFLITITSGQLNLSFGSRFAIAGISLAPAAQAPSAPLDLSAYATGSGRIALYWTAVSGASGYNVYRGTVAGGEDYAHPINGTHPVNAPSYPGSAMDAFTDTGLVDGIEYFYTIEAVGGGAPSPPSDEDSDTPLSGAVPWDTRNPGAVLSAFRNAFSVDETYLPNLRVVGPDGTIYDDAYGNAQLPDGFLNPSTDQATLVDGSVVTFEGEGYDLVQQTSSAVPAPGGYIRPNSAEGRLLGPSNGPYRRVQTVANLRGVQGNVTLPNTVVVNDASVETPHIYLGLHDGSDSQDVDAGLQYRGGAWQVFMRINGAYVQPGKNLPKNVIPALINAPTTGIRFLGGDTLTLRYYAYKSDQINKVPYKLSLLIADGTLLGNNDQIRSLGAVTHLRASFLKKRSDEAGTRSGTNGSL